MSSLIATVRLTSPGSNIGTLYYSGVNGFRFKQDPNTSLDESALLSVVEIMGRLDAIISQGFPIEELPPVVELNG